MKRRGIAFLLTALMVLSLTGCGEKDKNNGQTHRPADDHVATGTDKPVKPGSDTDAKPGSATDAKPDRDGDAERGKTSEKTKIDNTVSGTQTPVMTAKGYAAGRSSTLTGRQMLENGMVHDRDGYLLDGENSSWS